MSRKSRLSLGEEQDYPDLSNFPRLEDMLIPYKRYFNPDILDKFMKDSKLWFAPKINDLDALMYQLESEKDPGKNSLLL